MRTIASQARSALAVAEGVKGESVISIEVITCTVTVDRTGPLGTQSLVSVRERILFVRFQHGNGQFSSLFLHVTVRDGHILSTVNVYVMLFNFNEVCQCEASFSTSGRGWVG